MASDAQGIRLLVMVGPTAVGKTALSLRLGSAFGGEVVSADSRQVYRGMDIGTAKATLAERAAVPHHLIDIVDPDDELTLAHYQRMAADTIAAIVDRGALPMLVGGSGLYVRAVTEGWTVPEVPPDPVLRAQLEREAAEQGHASLHARLAAVDPAAAQRIDARNVRRVIRALEVYETLGQPISALQNKANPGYRLCTIGLTLPRPALYERIDARVDRMMVDGLVDEVRGLVARGYGYALPAMSALGYQQIGQHLRGEVVLDEAVALIKRHTRRFVRQQYNWFRLSDPAIRWFEASPAAESEVFRAVESFLTGAG
ncbi:MAG: tRNA (adenosine(37)-N6)-dimethylallyltransferase MiaA [Chloroflexi bacterium]|nr:tRNA (adenosine(37)-N6)-dimethylallyltransferase MiaA [Chloroflexota bacterium]